MDKMSEKMREFGGFIFEGVLLVLPGRQAFLQVRDFTAETNTSLVVVVN